MRAMRGAHQIHEVIYLSAPTSTRFFERIDLEDISISTQTWQLKFMLKEESFAERKIAS